MRQEYPRPSFVRSNWLNLNGTWDFRFDDDNKGFKEKWYIDTQFDLKIAVPFCFQSKLSKINVNDFHDRVWYKRRFKVEEKFKNKRVLLHIGACDYESEIFINHQSVIKHIGGQTSFFVDITDYLNYEEEEIVIYAYDPSTDQFIPRGKQYWKKENEGIWYTRTTGIWQTVWLEFVDDIYIDHVRMTPDIDLGILNLEMYLSKEDDLQLQVIVKDKGNVIINNQYQIKSNNSKFNLDIFQNCVFNSNTHHYGKLWSPESPYLFDIEFKLISNNKAVDYVKSYFGMRKIHQKDGLIYLNNRPYYQKLVLDQGYFEDGLLTAPSDEDFIRDIQLAKAMGFNGCRKHQKVEDPRFLYHADKLGFLVWGEMANSANFNFEYVNRMVKEWMNVIRRDYNHPCIVTWVPMNESWGVPNLPTSHHERNHILSLYHLTHSLDDTRLVISNDGWEMVTTDICAIHNYAHGNKTEEEKQAKFVKDLSDKETMIRSMPAGRKIYLDGFTNEGVPVMLTEFGGISFNNSDGWGYSSVDKVESFIEEYSRLINAINRSSCIVGFCYTQLTDVFQEKNGLLTFDRKPKVDVEIIKSINDKISLR